MAHALVIRSDPSTDNLAAWRSRGWGMEKGAYLEKT
jgi:hypothetical protein